MKTDTDYYWQLKIEHKSYNLDQPRVPAGSPGGGQWTSGVGREAVQGKTTEYEMTGDQLGTLYHGGKTKITEVDPGRLQSRDHGFYGAGFYMTTSRDYAKTYGRTLTKAQLSSDTRVLVSSLNSGDASPKLVEDVRSFTLDLWEKRAAERGRPFDRERAAGELQYEIDSPIGWARLVTSFGSHNGYDVIKHSDGEIVVRGYDKLEFLKWN